MKSFTLPDAVYPMSVATENNVTKNTAPERKHRIRRITQNFFLHIHAPRVHPHSLKPMYTLGLGVILGMLFMVMIVTGVLLMLHYTPSVEAAYDSVKDIVHIVPGGRIIRNIHRLASHAMVIVVFLHLLRVFYTGSYLGGRQLNWVIGVCMFILVLLMSFSGYLLPWDQLSYWAVTIGSNIAASSRELTDLLGITGVIDIGGFIKRLLIGGDTVGQTALTRFFMLHVVFFPLTLLILTGVHFWRIRKDGGLSRPVEAASPTVEKLYSWPLVMWIELAILLAVLALLVFLAFFVEAPLLEKANPSHPENPAKSPWYFLGIQELVSYSAFAGGLIVPVLFLYFMFSIPYRDREDHHIGTWFSGQKGRIVTRNALVFSTVVVLVQLVIMGLFGWLRDWFPGISQWFVMFFNPATITLGAFAGYSLLVRRKTGSSRMAAIALFTSAVVALIIFTVVGIWFRGANWEFVFGN
jgi:quinol-cytochrome oxidoreductase complex cytochrome b subunit